MSCGNVRRDSFGLDGVQTATRTVGAVPVPVRLEAPRPRSGRNLIRAQCPRVARIPMTAGFVF